MQPITLAIDLEATFNPQTCLTIDQARHLLRGRRGPATGAIVRRWASPKRGCPVGGVRLLLPTVKVGGLLLTMPEWVAAFERMRVRLGMRKAAAVEAIGRKGAGARAHERAMERLRAAGVVKG